MNVLPRLDNARSGRPRVTQVVRGRDVEMSISWLELVSVFCCEPY